MTQRFHERLRHHRTKLGLSQQELADRIGVSRVSLNRWENKKAVPTALGCFALADQFGITVEQLIKGGAE